MTPHAFVDESRRSSYLLVATLLAPAELPEARTFLRSLLLPGERRLHFQSERASRRREVLARLVDAGLHARIYESGGPADAARSTALTRLVEDLVKLDARRLVLESRGAADHLDRQVIAKCLSSSGSAPATLSYEHLRPHEDPALWVSDAVAWCYGAGGEWRRRVHPLVDDVIQVQPIRR